MTQFLTFVGNASRWVRAIASSVGSADAGKVVCTDSNGRLGLSVGGTGAGTADAARSNLNAARSNSNNDIQDMTALVGGISAPTNIDLRNTTNLANEWVEPNRVRIFVDDPTGLNSSQLAIRSASFVIRFPRLRSGVVVIDSETIATSPGTQDEASKVVRTRGESPNLGRLDPTLLPDLVRAIASNTSIRGLLEVTGDNSVSTRAVTAGSGGFADGGKIIALAGDGFLSNTVLSPTLRAIAALNTVGLIERTGAGTVATRTFTRIANTNGIAYRIGNLQLCFAERTLTQTTTALLSTLWTFPAAFASSIPAVFHLQSGPTASFAPTNQELAAPYVLGASLTTASLRINRITGMTNFQAADTMIVSAFAIGEWQ